MNDSDKILIETLTGVDFHVSDEGDGEVVLQLATNAGDHFLRLHASDLAYLGERFTSNAALLLAGRDRAGAHHPREFGVRGARVPGDLGGLEHAVDPLPVGDSGRHGRLF